jgi:hypothetical protein
MGDFVAEVYKQILRQVKESMEEVGRATLALSNVKNGTSHSLIIVSPSSDENLSVMQPVSAREASPQAHRPHVLQGPLLRILQNSSYCQGGMYLCGVAPASGEHGACVQACRRPIPLHVAR